MPVRHARYQADSQVHNEAEPKAAVKRLCSIIAMLDASATEREAAFNAALRMLAQLNLKWSEIADGFRLWHEEGATAMEAVTALLAENIELRAENDRLRAETSRDTAVALWSDVGAQVPDTRLAAEWALDLHRRRLVWLSDFEIQFLQSCTRWRGRLTPKMQPIFQQIMDRIVDRTGLTPPSA